MQGMVESFRKPRTLKEREKEVTTYRSVGKKHLLLKGEKDQDVLFNGPLKPT